MNSALFRQSSWMFTLPLAAIAVVYLTFTWLPGQRQIRAVREQAESKRQFVAQTTALSATLSACQQELDKVRSVVARWREASPHKRSTSALYGKINVLAKDAGLAIARFDPQPIAVHQQIHQIPLVIGCSGQFVQVFDFLRRIEGLPATIWIESLKIEKKDRTAKDVQCELDLVVFSDNPQTSDYARRTD